MSRTKSALLGLSALTALLGIAVNTADAQCVPGSPFCGEVVVQVGVPAPPVVYVQPAPPPPQVVYVQPAPPPPVVYVQPAPPPPAPVVVVQPAPQPQRVYVAPQRTRYVIEPTIPVEHRFALHGELGAMMSDRMDIGGGSVALRIRPNPYYALDLGLGAYGGSDFNGQRRVEVPLTADSRFFLNPQSPFQVYGLLGFGLSFASIQNDSSFFDSTFSMERNFAYVGGQLGVGLEWRLSPFFALNTDVRGFLRTRIDADTANPEFVEVNDNGSATGRTSNTSTGAYFTVGATLYL